MGEGGGHGAIQDDGGPSEHTRSARARTAMNPRHIGWRPKRKARDVCRLAHRAWRPKPMGAVDSDGHESSPASDHLVDAIEHPGHPRTLHLPRCRMKRDFGKAFPVLGEERQPALRLDHGCVRSQQDQLRPGRLDPPRL